MSTVVAIGEAEHIEGFALAGVIVKVAEDQHAVREAWDGLADDVGLVVLSAAAASLLGEARSERESMLIVTMPG